MCITTVFACVCVKKLWKNTEKLVTLRAGMGTGKIVDGGENENFHFTHFNILKIFLHM